MPGKNYTIKKVQYPSGGIEINALLFEPAGLSGKAPALVHHPSHKSPAKHYEWYLGKLAEAGYVGLGIEQRGYGSGATGENDRGGPLQQGDIANGILFLSGLPSVDAHRIGVSGHSNGAALALIVCAHDARVKACISLAPKTDWLKALRLAKEWKPDFYKLTVKEISGGAPPEENPAPFVERSPITYAKDIHVPVLFIVGAQDWVNPSYHCTDMHDALKARGNKNSAVEMIDEVDHFFCQRHFLGYRFDDVTEPALAWLDRHVKNA